MKAADYIVKFLEKKGISHIFGYPGGMVTHLMDSLAKSDSIQTHLTYHEQGAAFAACGYAQMLNRPSVVFATSGPGATNMITGIANAWFDSIPAIFISGQVNTYEGKGNAAVRQKGFQETDIVSLVKPITKYAAYIADADQLPAELEKAYTVSVSGRAGPVMLDIPMNVFRADIVPDLVPASDENRETVCESTAKTNKLIEKALSEARRPCFVLGNGVHLISSKDIIKLVDKFHIPVVTSMPGMDLLPSNHPCMYGFIGAYGGRTANTIVAKSDLLIAIGTRLDNRQIGTDRASFAQNAKLIRLDIDESELGLKVKADEVGCRASIQAVVSAMLTSDMAIPVFQEWFRVCDEIKGTLGHYDDQLPNSLIEKFSDIIPSNAMITTDVGQNQVWVAQSFHTNPGQRVLFTAGHGAMGYSLPAAIGAHYATGGKVIAFSGDGGIQMNIQELQVIFRDKLPVKVVVLNNASLGMIRHFQELYFDSEYNFTVEGRGYSVPDFYDIAKAYKLDAVKYNGEENDDEARRFFESDTPGLMEVVLQGNTYTKPKSIYNKPLSEQEPPLDAETRKRIDAL